MYIVHCRSRSSITRRWDPLHKPRPQGSRAQPSPQSWQRDAEPRLSVQCTANPFIAHCTAGCVNIGPTGTTHANQWPSCVHDGTPWHIKQILGWSRESCKVLRHLLWEHQRRRGSASKRSARSQRFGFCRSCQTHRARACGEGLPAQLCARHHLGIALPQSYNVAAHGRRA